MNWGILPLLEHLSSVISGRKLQGTSGLYGTLICIFEKTVMLFREETLLFYVINQDKTILCHATLFNIADCDKQTERDEIYVEHVQKQYLRFSTFMNFEAAWADDVD